MSPLDLITAAAILTGIALVIVLSLIIIDCVRGAVERTRASLTRAHRTVAAVQAGDFGPGEEHPRLIDLDSGHEYEWVDDFDDPANSGYANVLDHDFAWSRHELERVLELAELRSLDPSQIEQLRAKLDQ